MLDFTTHGSTERPHLLLLHSGVMTRREWDPYLAGLSRHFHLIVPTALGYGLSPRAAALRLEAMGQSVIELLDHLRVRRAHLLGSSMGGSTALYLALHHPRRVDRLVLFRNSYRAPAGAAAALDLLAERETWTRLGLEAFVRREHGPQGGPEAWQEVARRVAALFRESDLFSLEDLSRLEASTLLIAGDRDGIVPLEDVVAMYRAIPRAALWIAPNAAHLLGTEGWRRTAFEAEVIRFLTRDLPEGQLQS